MDPSRTVADGTVARFRESAQSVANTFLHTNIDTVGVHFDVRNRTDLPETSITLGQALAGKRVSRTRQGRSVQIFTGYSDYQENNPGQSVPITVAG